MVPPCSHRVSRVRRYSGYRWPRQLFAYRILTFYDWPSHVIRLNLHDTVFCPNPGSITTSGLASSAFARHYWRNLCWFLFLALLRCFSSGGSPHTPMYSVYDDKTFLLPDCSIRTLTAPRGLSQLVTSFIGSRCQGIPLVLFVAWPF